MKTKTVCIELTESQKNKLFEIREKLRASNLRGKPGMVLGQVLFTGSDSVVVVGIVPNEKAKAIQAALGSTKSKMMTDKMTRRRLEKARA